MAWGAAAVVAARGGRTVATVSALRESHAKRLAEAGRRRANLSAALADIREATRGRRGGGWKK